MSNKNNSKEKVDKFNSYLVVIQRTLLVVAFSWIYIILSTKNEYKRTIHQKVGIVLLICVNLIRFSHYRNEIKFIINLVKKYGKKFQKFFNLTIIDDISTLLIILSVIIGMVIKDSGNKLDHFKFQDSTNQNTIKDKVKILTIIQISLTVILLGLAIYKLFQKQKKSDFVKMVKIAKDADLDKKDLKKIYKYTLQGYDVFKLIKELKSNIIESLIKVLKTKKLPKNIKKKLTLLQKKFLKMKTKNWKFI